MEVNEMATNKYTGTQTKKFTGGICGESQTEFWKLSYKLILKIKSKTLCNWDFKIMKS